LVVIPEGNLRLFLLYTICESALSFLIRALLEPERGRYETPMSDVKRARTLPRGVFRRELFEEMIALGSCCVESFCKSGRAKHLGHALYVVCHRCDPDFNTRA